MPRAVLGTKPFDLFVELEVEEGKDVIVWINADKDDPSTLAEKVVDLFPAAEIAKIEALITSSVRQARPTPRPPPGKPPNWRTPPKRRVFSQRDQPKAPLPPTKERGVGERARLLFRLLVQISPVKQAFFVFREGDQRKRACRSFAAAFNLTVGDEEKLLAWVKSLMDGSPVELQEVVPATKRWQGIRLLDLSTEEEHAAAPWVPSLRKDPMQWVPPSPKPIAFDLEIDLGSSHVETIHVPVGAHAPSLAEAFGKKFGLTLEEVQVVSKTIEDQLQV